MRRTTVRLAAAIAVVSCCAAILVATVDIRADLGFFLPRGDTPATRLIADQLRQGPGSALILMAIGGGRREARLAASRAMARRLAAMDRFVFVSNGTPSASEADLEALASYRYVLNPPPTAADFSVQALREALESAVASLGTTFGAAAKRLLPRDPMLRTLDIARFWAAGGMGPNRPAPWESRDGERALLVALPHAEAYDFDERERIASRIRSAFEAASGAEDLTLELGGASVIGIDTRDRIKSEAQWLSIVSAILVGGFLLAVFRSPKLLLCLALPIAGGAIVGMTAVQLLFGQVHGVTLAFGSILIGVAVDYGVHLVAHTGGDRGPAEAASRIAPTLGLSAATTVVAFLPMALSSLPGLSQLGIFAAAGLGVAAAITLWIMPVVLVDTVLIPVRQPPRIHWVSRVPPRTIWAGAGVLTLAAAAYVIWNGGPLWSNDLRELSPIPRASAEFDRRFRADLGAPDVRRLIIVNGKSAESVLQTQEALMPRLHALVDAGALGAFDMAARYLPSMRKQEAIKARLPDPAMLKRSLDTALAGLPLRPEAFRPFLADVERARTSAPVTVAEFTQGHFGWRVAPLLHQRHGEWTGLVMLAGIADPAAIAAAAADDADGSARLFDLKEESERLLAEYRAETLQWITVGVVGALLLLMAGLRRLGTVLRVVAPIAVTTVLTVALLLFLEGSLTIIHVTGLLLVAGLGLDYALFLNRDSESADDAGRTVTGVLVCTATTIIVFAVLAFSALPVLNSMGKTVAIGAALSVTMAFLFRRNRRGT